MSGLRQSGEEVADQFAFLVVDFASFWRMFACCGKKFLERNRLARGCRSPCQAPSDADDNGKTVEADEI